MKFGTTATVVIGVLISIVGSGCSPSALFGAAIDEKVRQTRNYQQTEQACQELDLSSSRLSVSQTRQLVSCLNAGGALAKTERYLKRLSDAELAPVVKLLNDKILDDPCVLREIDLSFQAMDEQGALDPLFEKLGLLLGQEELITSSLSAIDDLAIVDGEFDPLLLKALQRLGAKVDLDLVRTGLDLGLTIAQAPSFNDIEAILALELDDQGLTEIVMNLVSFVRTSRSSELDSIQALLHSFARGELGGVLDEWLGADEETILSRVPQADGLLSFLSQNEARVWTGTTRLFRDFNQPIRCMKGAESLPNGVSWAIKEWVERHERSEAPAYLLRENPLLLAGFGAVCDYPAGLAREYGAFRELGQVPAAMWMHDFFSAFYRVQNGQRQRPLIDALTGLLADPKIERLTPTLLELDRRQVWPAGLLVSTSLATEDRASLESAIQFFLEADSESLGGKSLYDVVSAVGARVSWRTLFKLARAIGGLDELRDTEFVLPVVRALRQGHFSTDVYPIIDLTQELLVEAPRYQSLLTTVLNSAKYDEFGDAVGEIAGLMRSKELKNVVQALFSILRPMTQNERGLVRVTSAPEHELSLRHRLRVADLHPPAEELPSRTAEDQACDRIDLRFAFDDFSRGDYAEQFEWYARCLGGGNAALVSLSQQVRWLQRHRTPRGRSGLQVLERWIRSTVEPFAADELSVLTGGFLDWVNEGRFAKVNQLLPLFLSDDWESGAREGEPDHWSTDGSLAYVIARILKPVVGQPEAVETLAQLGADLVLQDELPRSIPLLDETLSADFALPTDVADPIQYWRSHTDEVERQVKAIECNHYQAGERRRGEPYAEGWARRRTHRIFEQATEAYTSWESGEQGRGRREWSKASLKRCFGGAGADPGDQGVIDGLNCDESLFEKLADPTRSRLDRSLSKGLLNYLGSFGVEDSSPQVSEMVQFFWDRSHDYRLIPYYYPGEDYPRLRLVNGLDRFELVLINADIDLTKILKRPLTQLISGFSGLKENMALQFIGRFADAWGDLPRDQWPEEIRQKYGSEQPPRLRDIYLEIDAFKNLLGNTIGYPRYWGCEPSSFPRPATRAGGLLAGALIGDYEQLKRVRRTLFNIHQLLPTVRENLPRSGHLQAGGLALLRGLFFELHYSSLAENQEPKKHWENNLSVVTRLARMGLLRQIGRAMGRFVKGDPALADWFSALTSLARAPGTEALVNVFLQQDFINSPERPFEDRLLWKAMDQFWEVLNEPASDRQIPALRQILLYGVASLGQLGEAMGPKSEANAFVAPALPALAAVFHHRRRFLERQSDWIPEILGSEAPAGWLRAFYENPETQAKAAIARSLSPAIANRSGYEALFEVLLAVERDTELEGGWTVLKRRWDVLENDPRLIEVDFSMERQKIVDWLAADASLGCSQLSLGAPGTYPQCRLRQGLAAVMRDSELTDSLSLVGETRPFVDLLQELGRLAGMGELDKFGELIRRSLRP